MLEATIPAMRAVGVDFVICFESQYPRGFPAGRLTKRYAEAAAKELELNSAPHADQKSSRSRK
jgi:hypothetical protein